MPNIKLTLEYDGSRFFGSQRQLKGRTVQAELESALEKLFQKRVRVIAAGRTDSGVHAAGQVVHFHIDSKLPLWNIQSALNHYLPEDISVVGVQTVPRTFHAQRSAKWKTYEYRVLNSQVRSPLQRFQSYWYPHRLNLTKMKRAARVLVGARDFWVFESSGGRRKTSIRTIRKFKIEKDGNLIRFVVESNGFLYKMVRSMVGTLLEVGGGRLPVTDLQKAIASKNRKLIGPTVPPHGLCLKRVVY